MPFEITRGKQNKALRCLIYGVEGVGKTTLAAQFPDPLFIDCEGGIDFMDDVARFPRPTSWQQLILEVQQVIQDPSCCKTLIIDTIDWAEAKAIEQICAAYQVKGIEDFGWSKGYTYLHEEIGRLLNLLNDVRDKGINVVLTAHMNIRTVTLPDEQGSYDRYELKLKSAKNGNNCQLVKEWADMVLFLNFKQFVVEDSKTKKSKVTGGRQRVMYANHTAAWDAKNRFGLPDELPLDFKAIAHLFTHVKTSEEKVKELFGPSQVEVVTEQKTEPKPAETIPTPAEAAANPTQYLWQPVPYTATEKEEMSRLPKALQDLMRANMVHPDEIQKAVSDKGYFPRDMDIDKYAPDFIQGCLIGAWPSVLKMIQDDRDLPY